MVYAEVVSVATTVPMLFERNDDDMYDRLSHRWIAALLIAFAGISTATAYVGKPMHCWVPAHFTGGWANYANNYCWIKNTWFLPFENEIPKELEERKTREIVYYQWIPIILMFQALLFFLPIVLWRNLNARTGIDMNDIIETAEKVQICEDLQSRENRLKLLTQQSHRYLGVSKTKPKNRWSPRWLLSHCFCVCCGKNFGNYITALYIFIKLVFLANIIGQMFMLNQLLGHDFTSYGSFVLSSLVSGYDWSWSSDRFPRVTMCDFDIRILGNQQRYTIQCVLTINLFTEKMYLVIWFAFLIAAILTVYGLILLIMRVFLRGDRLNYISKHLQLGNVYDPNRELERDLVHNFVYAYLQMDGVLLMRLVGHNTNQATVTDLICSLFLYYKELPKIKKGIEAASDEHLMDDSKPEKLPM